MEKEELEKLKEELRSLYEEFERVNKRLESLTIRYGDLRSCREAFTELLKECKIMEELGEDFAPAYCEFVIGSLIPRVRNRCEKILTEEQKRALNTVYFNIERICASPERREKLVEGLRRLWDKVYSDHESLFERYMALLTTKEELMRKIHELSEKISELEVERALEKLFA